MVGLGQGFQGSVLVASFNNLDLCTRHIPLLAPLAIQPPHPANRHDAGCDGARTDRVCCEKLRRRQNEIPQATNRVVVVWGFAALLIMLWVRSHWWKRRLVITFIIDSSSSFSIFGINLITERPVCSIADKARRTTPVVTGSIVSQEIRNRERIKAFIGTGTSYSSRHHYPMKSGADECPS